MDNFFVFYCVYLFGAVSGVSAAVLWKSLFDDKSDS